jgi:hypothetical protein
MSNMSGESFRTLILVTTPSLKRLIIEHCKEAIVQRDMIIFGSSTWAVNGKRQTAKKRSWHRKDKRRAYIKKRQRGKIENPLNPGSAVGIQCPEVAV